MTARDFVYWLQGMFELTDVKALDEHQTELVRKHLAMVFIHDIDPKAGDLAHREKLNEAHGNSLTKEQKNELQEMLGKMDPKPWDGMIRC